MTESRSRALRGTLCSLLGGVCWGLSGTCGQYLFANYSVDSLWLTRVRLLSGGTVLLLWSLLRFRGELLGMWRRPRDMALLVLYGIFGLMFCQYAYMTSISWSNAATTTVLQNVSLVLIMLYTCLQARRRPKRKEVLSLLLALFGIFMIATGGNPTQMVLSRQGLLWGLTTAVAITLYTLLPRPLLSRWPQVPVLASGMLTGAVILNLITGNWSYRSGLPASGWLTVAAIVLLGTLMSFVLFMQGLRDIGPVKSSMLVVTEPVAATVLSAVWLGTTFSWADYVGFAAIIATIFLLAKPEDTKKS